MATLKKNTSSLCLVAALMVVIATVLPFSCHAHHATDHQPASFPLPASCYSNYFPHCTTRRCKRFCAGDGKPPVPRAFCNDNSNCCCPVG